MKTAHLYFAALTLFTPFTRAANCASHEKSIAQLDAAIAEGKKEVSELDRQISSGDQRIQEMTKQCRGKEATGSCAPNQFQMISGLLANVKAKRQSLVDAGLKQQTMRDAESGELVKCRKHEEHKGPTSNKGLEAIKNSNPAH